MMNNWKYRLLSGWNLMRILRLGLGSVMLVEALINSDVLVGALGIILLSQSLFNVGCCTGGACYTGNKKLNNDGKEISFEEIKTHK